MDVEPYCVVILKWIPAVPILYQSKHLRLGTVRRLREYDRYSSRRPRKSERRRASRAEHQVLSENEGRFHGTPEDLKWDRILPTDEWT